MNGTMKNEKESCGQRIRKSIQSLQQAEDRTANVRKGLVTLGSNSSHPKEEYSGWQDNKGKGHPPSQFLNPLALAAS